VHHNLSNVSGLSELPEDYEWGRVAVLCTAITRGRARRGLAVNKLAYCTGHERRSRVPARE